MHIVRLQLTRVGTYWFFDNINLTPAEPTSKPFDLDLVSEEVRKNILRSVNDFHIIDLIEVKDIAEPEFKLANPNGLEGFQLREDDDVVVSVTVSDEVEEPPPIIRVEPTDKDYEEARLLLDKNGNTVTKSLRSLDVTQEIKPFLLACIEVEKKNRKRTSVLSTLEEVFLSVSQEVK